MECFAAIDYLKSGQIYFSFLEQADMLAVEISTHDSDNSGASEIRGSDRSIDGRAAKSIFDRAGRGFDIVGCNRTDDKKIHIRQLSKISGSFSIGANIG